MFNHGSILNIKNHDANFFPLSFARLRSEELCIGYILIYI